MGALRLSPFSGIMKHLGYPAYFMLVLLIPDPFPSPAEVVGCL